MQDSQQLARLAAMFATPDPGQPPPDPAILGDPTEWNGYAEAVRDLQGGKSPAEVLNALRPEQREALFAIDPAGRAPEPAITFPEESPAPPLPAAAHIDPSAARGASPWLDAYVDFSRQWSPRAYDGFHAACGLWLLSTVAARRVVCHFGGERFTNLYIALTARTSLWAKSTTAKIVGEVLQQSGLDWLLAADDATPQKFIADLSLTVPQTYDQMAPEAQARAMNRMRFPAARGWFFEEFGTKVSAMMREGGFMADFRGILRAWDDCPRRYEYATIGRGNDIVERPYLALLANMTPADLRSAAKRNDALWNDGFWARFAFVTPPAGTNPSRARFPEGQRIIPAHLLTPLRRWHERLGWPEVQSETVDCGDAKGMEKRAVLVDAPPLSACTMGTDIVDAFYSYHDALTSIAAEAQSEDLDGNYSRFAEKALRVAMLLASLENDGIIEARHWSAGQTVAEGWRANLHHLYGQVNQAQPSEEKEREEAVLRIVNKLGEPTAADVARYIRGASSREVAMTLDGLTQSGALDRRAGRRKGVYRYAIMP